MLVRRAPLTPSESFRNHIVTLGVLFALLGAVAVIAPLSATRVSQRPPREAQAIAATIERELRQAGIPGASFAIVSGDAAVAGRFGLADVERGVAMTPATLLQVGSLNKLMTALALASTLEEQRISFDAAVGKHVTGLSSRVAALTFHQLLSQTAGLRDIPGASGSNDETALATRARAITESDFVVPPGTVFSYSNLGYAVAGYALEQLRKKSFADALYEAALNPLLMHKATLRLASVSKDQHAWGHRLEKSVPVTIREIDNDASLWPAGYLWTSAGEMLPLLRVLVSGDPADIKVSRVAVTRATTPQAAMPNVFVGGHYGYGLMIASDRGVRIYEHGGTQRGFSSILRVAPDRRFGVVILTNLDGAPLRRIAENVMAAALDLPPRTLPQRDERPVSTEEMKDWLGVYRNRGTAEIRHDEGRIVLILDDGAPMQVSRIGENRYLARPKPEIAGPEFVLQPATATAPPYLHFALWAYAR